MDEFVSAFVTVRDAMLDNATTAGIDGPWLGYVQSANRLAEVAIVTPCVARLVTSELHPPSDETPVGRFSNRIVPPLGRFLPELGPHQSAVRRLVMLRVAYGYLAMIDAEATTIAAGAGVTVTACREAEELWPYWVTNMSTGWVLEATDPEFVRRVRDVCGEDLYHGLLDLDLVGWRRRKVPYIGHFYADAGMVLRFVQTDVFQPDIPSELFAAASRWPFEELPTE